MTGLYSVHVSGFSKSKGKRPVADLDSSGFEKNRLGKDPGTLAGPRPILLSSLRLWLENVVSSVSEVKT
jgi:hypothetical protein